MKIAVLCIYSFPYGMAATNRIAAYTQGLVENGAEVDVITIHPTEPPLKKESNLILPDEGIFNGVHYIHPSGRYRNKSKFLRALAMKSGWRFWSGVYRVYKLLKQNHYDGVIMSFDEPLQLWVYSKLIHICGSKSIFIFDEYPIPIRHKLKNDIPNWKKFAYRNILKIVDGYISINERLAQYYMNFCARPYLLLPVIVNNKKFVPAGSKKKDWITYIGNMEAAKDNVTLIAEAFSLISNKYPSYSLHFFGPDRGSSAARIKDIANAHNLGDRIILEGSINSELVPAIIDKSKVMVSSQPDTLRAKGGFPTKLGEYVIMGVPTLLSDVGENSKYLTDKDCFFVEPDNPEAYASKLDYILSNYDEALKRGSNGRQTIVDNYSQLSAGEKIFNFINSLSN